MADPSSPFWSEAAIAAALAMPDTEIPGRYGRCQLLDILPEVRAEQRRAREMLERAEQSIRDAMFIPAHLLSAGPRFMNLEEIAAFVGGKLRVDDGVTWIERRDTHAEWIAMNGEFD